MNLSNIRPFRSFSKVNAKPSMIFGLIIITALFAFEIFNYSTTDYALRDLLGDLRFAGIRWATILAIAFCGIDFAGIARLFTPQQGSDEPREIWYLFGAWLLAATMNAMLTWWGVSMAVLNHNIQSTTVMDGSTIIKVVPIFVAIMVWVIRILIIGTISAAADHLLWEGSKHRTPGSNNSRRRPIPTSPSPRPTSINASPANPRPANSINSSSNGNGRPEPTYHSLSMASRKTNQNTRSTSSFQ
jgi:hypothetical protein